MKLLIACFYTRNLICKCIFQTMNHRPTILDKIVGTLSNLMSKFHVPCKNIVHLPAVPLAQYYSWWKNLRTCLAQY